jgi:putative flippase GtrA
MLYKLWDHKKIRFLCVGSFNSLCDITILNTLVFTVHTPVWVANTISVSFGITLSYFLNHFIVFRYHHSPNTKLFTKFFLVTGTSVIAIQTLIIYLIRPMYQHLIAHLHYATVAQFEAKISLNLAKVTAILIGMFWNYLFYSRVVFKQLPKNEEAEEITRLV